MSRVKNRRICPTCLEKIGKLKIMQNDADECKSCVRGAEKRKIVVEYQFNALSSAQRYKTYAK